MIKNILIDNFFIMKKLKFNLKKFLSISLFLSSIICVFILSSCLQPKIPLRLGTNVWPGYENFYLARDLGYYDDTSIKLVEYSSASEVLRAYRNGDLEAAALTMDEVLLLATTEANLKVILVTDISNGGDVIIATSDIKTLEDIKGKKVGVESNALGAYVITRALQTVNLSVNDIEIVSLSVSEHEKAFDDGIVDAVVTFEPVRSNLLQKGAKQIFDSTQIPGEIVDVVVIREDILKNQFSSLNDLITGWFKAFDYLKENPEDAAKRIAPREQVTPEQFLESLKGLHLPNLEENKAMLSKKDTSLLNAMNKLSQVMIDNKLLSKSVDGNSLLDAQIVESVKF